MITLPKDATTMKLEITRTKYTTVLMAILKQTKKTQENQDNLDQLESIAKQVIINRFRL